MSEEKHNERMRESFRHYWQRFDSNQPLASDKLAKVFMAVLFVIFFGFQCWFWGCLLASIIN